MKFIMFGEYIFQNIRAVFTFGQVAFQVKESLQAPFNWQKVKLSLDQK
jgi:hypothetical protein